MDESKVDGVDPLSVTRRLQRDGRWTEAEAVRDRLIKECKNKGMSKPRCSVLDVFGTQPTVSTRDR